MSVRNKIIRITTIVVVTMLVINPEFFLLGLFIDGVGLELLLMLFSVQIASICTDYYYYCRNIVFPPIKAGYTTLKSNAISTFTSSSEPIIMIGLVVGAIISFTINRL